MPDQSPPQIDLAKWGDRAATPDVVEQCFPTGSEFKPIAIRVEEFEIRMLSAQHLDPRTGSCDPAIYNQFLLERFKDAGAPVEGILHLKLAHGAICKVKTNPMEPQTFFQYLWIPAEYALAIANAGRGGN